MVNFILRNFRHIKERGFFEIFRKILILVKIFLKFPIYIVAVIPCLLIRLISPLILIRIDVIAAGTLGRVTKDLAIYICKKNLKIDQPKRYFLDLLYIHYNDKIYNKQIAKMLKRKINIFSGYILEPISKVNKLMPGWKKHSIKGLSYEFERDVDNLIDKHQPLTFTKEEKVYGKEMLAKFGLKESDKFVCFAIRDTAYQKKKISSRFKDWSYHDYRNQDADNFLLAAEELAKRGYYVFRTGVVQNKPFQSKNPKIIDYANSKLRNDFMDVYLGGNCLFCLTTDTGFNEMCYIFQRPIAYTSMPLGGIPTYHKNFLHITKHHILTDEKRKLSLSEIFSHGVAYAHDSKIFKEKGIELADNTPSEIRDLALEMLENLEGKKTNFEEEDLQKKTRELFIHNINLFNYRAGEKNPMQLYNSKKYHAEIRSKFCNKFLKENKHWVR